MSFKIATKLILYTVILLVTGSVFLGLFFVQHETAAMRQSMERLGRTMASNLADNSEWNVLTGDSESLQRVIESMMNNEPDLALVEIRASRGVVLARAKKESRFPVKYYRAPVIMKELSSRGDFLTMSPSSRKKNEVIGSVRLGLSLENMIESADYLKKVGIASVAIVIILVCLGVVAVTRYLIAEPLVVLMDGIERIARGDLDHRITMRRHDELGMLAVSFNAMAKKLDLTHVSREYIDQILNSMFNCLVVVNADGLVTLTNQATVELFGYSEDELVGKPLSILFAADVPAIANLGLIKNQEKVIVAKGGFRIPVLFSVTRVEGSTKWSSSYVCVAQNITERKWAEDQLQKFNRELERSNQDLEQFAYIASHDLQEPLRMVTGYLQLLERRFKGNLDQSADEFIDFAVDGARRMQQLIDALLMYSRVGRHQRAFGDVDAGQVLSKALQNLTVAIAETGAAVTNDPLPVVWVDEIQLIQLFQNLVGNALKFRGDEPVRVHVSAREEARQWVFTVADNGIGIDPKYKDRIFIIFQRLHSHSKYPGTGIGLAVCKKIVERWGGSIGFEPKSDRGTIFFFTVPKKGVMPYEY